METDYDPETISSYYPKDSYYSYQVRDTAIGLKLVLYRILFSDLEPSAMGLAQNVLGWPFRQLLRGLRIRPGSKVLDVGCGGGKFLALIKALGMKPFGVEINPDSVAACSDITDQIYIGPFEGFGEDILFSGCPENKFDHIVSNHVIEHSANPGEFLKAAGQLLSNEGLAIIATPNPRSFCAAVFKNYWAQLDTPRHLYLIPPAVMRRYAAAADLEILDIRHTGDQHGFVGSLLYVLEDKWSLTIPASRKRKIEAVGKVLFFPFYSIFNLLGFGDTVEYTLRKAS